MEDQAIGDNSGTSLSGLDTCVDFWRSIRSSPTCSMDSEGAVGISIQGLYDYLCVGSRKDMRPETA